MFASGVPQAATSQNRAAKVREPRNVLSRHRTRLLQAAAVVAGAMVLADASPAWAQATWNGVNASYNTAANWTPANVPNAAGESAIFANTGTTLISLFGVFSPDSWTFNANSQTYTFIGSGVTFSNAATVTNNANVGQTIFIDVNVTGTTLTQAGATSTLSLSAVSTFTNTSVTSGTLENVGNLISTVTNTASFTNSGTLTGPLNNNAGGVASNSGTITGLLTNGGTFTQTSGSTDGGTTNTGTINANGGAFNGAVANNAGGNFNVGGTVTSNSTFGNAGGGTLTINGGGSYTVSGVVTNNGGGVQINNGGTLASGSTISNAAGTFVSAAGGTVNANINNAAGASLTNSGTWTGTVANSGTFNNQTGGTVSGLVTNTAGATTSEGALNGGATVNGGTLQIGAGGANGTITGNILNNTQVTFNRSGTVTYAEQMSGTGVLVQAGLGTLALTNANSYQGGTNLNAGTIQVGHNTALGTGSVTIQGGATLQAGATGLNIANNLNLNGIVGIGSGAGTFTLSGEIINGGFYKLGSGTLVLVKASTRSGGTSVLDGTLQLNHSSAAGTVAILLANGTTLKAGVNNLVIANDIGLVGLGSVATIDTGVNTMTLNGVFYDAGGFNKTGGGQLNVTGTGVTGNIIVSAGALAVNGSTATSALTTVNAGATLGGAGAVGNTTINGGTLAPGNSIGTLTVQGNLIFTAASTYLVEVDPNNSDRTNVTGTATLGGATVSAQFAPGSYVAKKYTIINATGGFNGTFNTLVNTNLPAGFQTALSYDPNNAYLDLTLSFTPPATPNFGGGLNANQLNVANALINSFNTAGGIPLVFGLLTPQGLTQVGGQSATGSQQTTFHAMGAFIEMLTDPHLGNRSGGAGNMGANGYADEAMAYAGARGRNAAERDAYAKMALKAPLAGSFDRRWGVWGAGYGGTSNTDGNAVQGTVDTRSRIGGGAAGLDYRFGPDTVVGFSLGGAGTTYSLVGGVGGGRSEMFQAGVYGRHYIGATYIAAALAYGWQDVTTDRIALLNRYRANFDASALSGRLEVGHRFALGASGLTPYGAGQFTTFYLPGYAEQTIAGVNTFALAYAEKDVTASRSELGLRADTSFTSADAIVTLRGRAAWAHNFNIDRSVSAIFQTLPASGFTVNGAAQARDSALLSAGAEARWLNGWSVAATFEGEFSSITESYGGKGVVRYQW